MSEIVHPQPGDFVHGHRFSETLRNIERRAEDGPVSVGELFAICGPQGHAFAAIFLVLPFLQPLPLPGLSNAIGIVLAIIGVFVALRKPPWLPARLAGMTVEPDAVRRICARLEKLLSRIEKFVQPRAQWLFERRWFRVTNAVVWIVHALVFSLPLPIPLTNFFPATVILLMAVGILEEDLRFVLLAYAGAVANVIFFGALAALPAVGWRAFSS
ncbi:MAG TPA: exopolysaccharide biosynthesis protein [Candidatus Binatia bacterium]|jgi:hypothetical protein